MRGEKQSWTCQERWVKNKQRTSGNLWDEVGWYSRLSPRVIPKHLIRNWQYLKAPGICTHQSYTDKWVRSALTAVYPCRCCCTPMGLHQLAHKGQWRKRRCPPSSALHQTGLPPLSGAIIPTSSTLPTVPIYFQLLSVTEPVEATPPWLQSTAQPASKLRRSRTWGWTPTVGDTHLRARGLSTPTWSPHCSRQHLHSLWADHQWTLTHPRRTAGARAPGTPSAAESPTASASHPLSQLHLSLHPSEQEILQP